MSHFINLRINTFEPTRIDVVQGSQGPEFVFMIEDITVPGAGATLYIKDPFGIVNNYTCTKHASLNAVKFKPDQDTFMVPGKYAGSLEIDNSGYVYTFPVFFTALLNPGTCNWKHVVPAGTLAPGGTISFSTDSLIPYGPKIVMHSDIGAAYIADESIRYYPDSSDGPLEISFDVGNDPEVVITNISGNTIGFPDLIFNLYADALISFTTADERYVPDEYRPSGYFDGTGVGVAKVINGGTVSQASGTSWKTVQRFSVNPGAWVVTASCAFASNATGRRALCISNTEDGNMMGYNVFDSKNAVDGSTTGLQCVFFLNLQTATDFYLNVYQNSGGALNCYPRVHMIKIA